MKHSFDHPDDEDEIDRIPGGHRREDRENRRHQDTVAHGFHATQLGVQYAAEQLSNDKSVRQRAQKGAADFRVPVEFASLQYNNTIYIYIL